MKMKRAHGFWWPNGGEAYGERYIRHAPDMEVALAYLPPERRRVAVQAGGHVGVWPLWLSSRFRQVFTFEPEPGNFAALDRNVRHAPNVLSAQVALGDGARQVGLKFNAKNIGGHKVEAGSGVQMWTIDGLGLEGVDFIMLDVEGYEFPALEGGLKTITRDKPVIMLEDREHNVKRKVPGLAAIRAMLAPLGYQERARVSHDVVFAC